MSAPSTTHHHALESPALRVPKAAPEPTFATPVARPRPAVTARTELKRTPSANVEKRAATTLLLKKSASFSSTAAEKKVLHFESVAPPAPIQKTPSDVERKRAAMTARLTSALAAAYRATVGRNLGFARRVYEGMLADTERFQAVEESAAFWTSFALFEEHCGRFRAALETFERGLARATDRAEVASNCYLFLLRMDERISAAVDGDGTAPSDDLVAMHDFVAYARSNQPDLAELRQEQKEALMQQQQQPELVQLMRIDETAAAAADRACEALEVVEEPLRRSARLAAKERINYAHPVPWWLREDASENF